MNPPDIAVDLSVWQLFSNAHIVVKIVMIGLLAVSVWSWAIILEKFFLFAKTRKETDKFEQVFWSGQSLEELYQALAQRRNTGMAALFVAAMREWKRSLERDAGKPMPGVQLRVDKVMDVTISREVERMERRLTFLATVGSTAPFVGLFGTVWGIMSSFQAIAMSKNTNIAVVAPGIAEALFATALGLLAAIPAVIFYNKFNSEVARQASRLEGFADEFGAILSRQIDRTSSGISFMAVGLQVGGALGGRRARRRSARPMAEINVTPMVDVMLVLLIIFMVTAPLLTVGVPIDLPKTDAKQIEGDKEPLTISIQPDGKIFLQETELSLDEIVPKLTAISKNGFDERIFVRGDRRVDYGQIMKVMATINAAGFRRIALISDLEDKP